jgi:RNA polymerase sigma-70 factor, ECF subfamily
MPTAFIGRSRCQVRPAKQPQSLTLRHITGPQPCEGQWRVRTGRSRSPCIKPRDDTRRDTLNGDERTDAALLEATAAGDDAAFAVLVRRYIRAATLLAAQFLMNRHDAEDVMQDAFVVVHRNARKFDSTRSFAPWFFAIVRRLASNRRARQARRARLLQLWGRVTQGPSGRPQAEAALNAGLDAATARRAVDALPPMQRSCFDLVEVRGFTTEEVAQMHGLSESTVRQHVFRARTTLRARLDGTSAGPKE